jgi:hypothetical protein
MGQDPDELREAIEDTRRRMDDTVLALERKIDIRTRVRERVRSLDVRRAIPYIAAAVALTGGVVTAVVVLRVRGDAPPERLAVPVKRLPAPAKDRALPLARSADRLLARTADEIEERRRRAVASVSREIAEALAEEQDRRNPWWVRIARDAGGAAATTGATLMVRRMLTPGPRPATRQENEPWVTRTGSLERSRSSAGR